MKHFCSICACLSLITILALPNTFIYITFFFLVGRSKSRLLSASCRGGHELTPPSPPSLRASRPPAVYSNSLMATLNARKSLRDASSHDVSVSLRDIQPAATNLSNIAPYASRRADGIAIRIDTTKDTKHDGSEVRRAPSPLFYDPRPRLTGAPPSSLSQQSQYDSSSDKRPVEEV